MFDRSQVLGLSMSLLHLRASLRMEARADENTTFTAIFFLLSVQIC